MFSNSKRLWNVTILYNKSNHFGLEHDAELLKKSLAGYGTVRFADPLEHPAAQDINIHLEVPHYTHVPWATYNVFVMNPEYYVNEAYEPYMNHFDLILTKEDLKRENAHIIPWTLIPFTKQKVTSTKEFLYLLGGSKNKRAMAQKLLPFWKESYPTIHVYSTEPLNIENVTPNVKLYVEDLKKEKREALLSMYEGHVCCSDSEGFGYTAAEANYVNAFTILNTLPVYVQDYTKSQNVAWIQTSIAQSNEKCTYGKYVSDFENAERDLDSAIESFSKYVRTSTSKSEEKQRDFKYNLLKIFDTLKEKTKLKHLPPLLDRRDCPPISIVTLVYNRRKFFDLAKHNILLTDYPKEKIQWVIVDDSDTMEEQCSDKIVQTQEQFTGMDIRYVPLFKKTPVSQKRNIGVENCSNDIVLFMDDDDHYPETSFRRRVAWLTRHPMKPKAVVCTTIACYDLIKGVSAVNVPPFDLPLGQRISEATLTFYKSWYEEHKMESNIQVGEGESLVRGRESDVLEIPPQQIIVAFSHNKNTSSRRIPATDGVEPSCFFGFPREYLTFVHALAGVKVVAS
jgi:hypothetical protein